MNTATGTVDRNAQPRSRFSTATRGRAAPATRRAPTSHSTDITQNAAMMYRPFHLVPIARPSIRPAARRHGRKPIRVFSATSTSGRARPSASTGSAAASFARALSWSISRHPKAASTKNISTPSSSAVRLITKCSPSTAISAPARQPRNVERNSRRPIRHSISTDSVPSSAVMNRQPNGSKPKISSPRPITYLPTGGWTTYAASVGIGTLPPESRTSRLTSLSQFTSKPRWTSAHASFA